LAAQARLAEDHGYRSLRDDVRRLDCSEDEEQQEHGFVLASSNAFREAL